MIPYNYRPKIRDITGNDIRPFGYAQWKRNGISVQVRMEGRTLQYWTRHPTNITEKMRWAETLTTWGGALANLPDNTILVGELWCPGQPASQVKTYIKEQNLELQWECYAILQLDGVGEARIARNGLEAIEQFCESNGVPFVPYGCGPEEDLSHPNWPHLLSRFDIKAEYELERTLCNKVGKSDDIEGLILKESNLVGWQRYKPNKTIDLIIVGTIAAKTGKFSGLVGSLVCATSEGHIVGRVSGMDDTTRRELTTQAAAGTLNGAVIEVQYQCIESRGGLRHGQFVRFRDDKNVAQCSVWQDKELARVLDHSYES